MELPLFRHVSVTRTNQSTLVSLVDSINLNSYPAYITFDSNFDESEIVEMSHSIANHLSKNGTRYKLPFPLYLITNLAYDNHLLLIEKSTSSLPKYFKVSRRNPNQRELQILKRINILREQIEAIPVNKILEAIKTRSKNNRLLKEQSKRLDFYETITQKLGL